MPHHSSSSPASAGVEDAFPVEFFFLRALALAALMSAAEGLDLRTPGVDFTPCGPGAVEEELEEAVCVGASGGLGVPMTKC